MIYVKSVFDVVIGGQITKLITEWVGTGCAGPPGRFFVNVK